MHDSSHLQTAISFQNLNPKFEMNASLCDEG